jgi:hypothetical protein
VVNFRVLLQVRALLLNHGEKIEMKIKNTVLFIALGVILSSTTAFAGVRKGATEIDTNWLFSYTKADTTNSGSIGGRFGFYRFLTDQLQLGASVQDFYTHSESKTPATRVGTITVPGTTSKNDNNNLGLNVVAKVYLAKKTSVVAPFLGVQGGFATMNSTGDVNLTGSSYGGIVGLKIFTSEDAALNLEANYSHNTLKGNGISSSNDDFKALIGFAVFFGGNRQ